ncbi:class I SAM-dependent methyltransferase [Patescibacteria group bacterium]|nr:class I SAM-dependent methyltransferase [Patescibacteria group bacterium]
MKILFKNINYDWRHLMSVYKDIVKQSDTVVEIGASAVTKTDELSHYCQKVIGIEYFPQRLPKNHHNITYLQGDWQNLTKYIKPKTVNILIASHVIEHIENDTRAINETYKVLKKNGIAIILTPNRKRLAKRFIELFFGKQVFPSGEHQREYIESEIIHLINKSEFKKFLINPVIIGIHNGRFAFFSEQVPLSLKKFSNYWEIILKK